jgi:hypothetical protein
MGSNSGTSRQLAEEYRSNQEHIQAAGSFISLSYLYFGNSKINMGTLDENQVEAAQGLRNLMSGVTCYRLGQSTTRAQNLAEQGILIAEDVRDHVATFDAQRALMKEYIGDLRVIADLDGADGAYQTAHDEYAEIDNPIHWQAEPAFQVLMTEFLSMTKAAGHDIPRMEKPSIKSESLVDRITYKRERFPEIVESLLTIEEWDEVHGP